MRFRSFHKELKISISIFPVENVGELCKFLEQTFCPLSIVKATFHSAISMRGQRATGKIQRNNYHHGSCRPSLTGKTSSVSLIFTHGMHRNVKNH